MRFSRAASYNNPHEMFPSASKLFAGMNAAGGVTKSSGKTSRASSMSVVNEAEDAAKTQPNGTLCHQSTCVHSRRIDPLKSGLICKKSSKYGFYLYKVMNTPEIAANLIPCSKSLKDFSFKFWHL